MQKSLESIQATFCETSGLLYVSISSLVMKLFSTPPLRLALSLPILGLIVGTAPARAQNSGASAADLRCEYLTNPLSVDTATPRLSWTIDAKTRGWMQSAYQIEAASSEALLSAGKSDLWDSGRVASNKTLGVRYAGKPIGAGNRAFWRVRVWDNNGRTSAFSAPQNWGMALMKETNWRANWIASPKTPDGAVEGLNLPAPSYFRRSFTLGKPIARATLFATARGVYEMRLNGAPVSDELLAPGWTDYHKRIQVRAFDVTSKLKRGDNAIGAVLGDGWYRGYIGYGHKREHYGDTTALRAQLDVQFRDGTRQIIGTDNSWQTNVGPIVYSDMLMGEQFDARKIQRGWDTPLFAAQGWKNALDELDAPTKEEPKTSADVTAQLRAAIKNNALDIVASNDIAGDPAFQTVKSLKVNYTVGGKEFSQNVAENERLQLPAPGQIGVLAITDARYGAFKEAPAPETPVQLVGTSAPPIRVTQELKPRKMTQPTPGTYIFDLGQNMVGVARLRVKGAAGTKVQLRFAEMLDDKGNAYTANLRSALATDTYICSGDGLETWTPSFTFHGFRYVEVTSFPGTPTLDAITGLVIGSDIAKTGTLVTSSAMVNQLQSNIDWGQRGNFLSVPTDCPQRDERLGWLGDAQVFAKTATYNRDVAAFFDKWLQDVEDAQAPDGGFPNVAPRVVTTANGAPAWGDAGVIVPWQMYRAYGDPQFVNDRWDAMTRWMDYLTQGNPDGLRTKLLNNNFGDWLSIEAATPKDVLATAYYAYDATLMAKMARATGRTSEAAKYDALFEKIKAAFNAAYVKSDGTVKGETQTCYLLALSFDLLPPDLRPVAAKHLADDIIAKGNHLSTGFIGVSYLNPTLTRFGYNDLAYKLLLQDTFPSWGFSIKQGATTIWERWDGYTPDKGFQTVKMNSFNHYSLGSVGQWMFGDMAGIQTDPDYPGFERSIIAPQPGPGLSFVNASYDSVHGKIVSNWKRENGATTYDVTIPANTSATVKLPAQSASQIREGGRELTKAPGVKLVSAANGLVSLNVSSGSYRFSVASK